MKTTTLQIVMVLRTCKQCGETKPLNFFAFNGKHGEHVCKRCSDLRNPPPAHPGMIAHARGIVITEQGHADLREWRREEQA